MIVDQITSQRKEGNGVCMIGSQTLAGAPPAIAVAEPTIATHAIVREMGKLNRTVVSIPPASVMIKIDALL